MYSNLNVKDLKLPLEKYKLDQSKVYILPEINDNQRFTNTYCEESFDFYKFLKHVNGDFEVDYYTNDNDVQMHVMHSDTIVLPTLYFFFTQVAMPMLIMSVYDYLKYKMFDDKSKNVKFKAVAEDNQGNRKVIEYEGPANEFKCSFEKIDINKLFKE